MTLRGMVSDNEPFRRVLAVFLSPLEPSGRFPHFRLANISAA